MDKEQKIIIDPNFQEEKVEFKAVTDKDVYSVVGENGKSVVEITGYDVKFKFNFDVIETPEDVDEASYGIGELFKKLIMEQLVLERNSTTKSQ